MPPPLIVSAFFFIMPNERASICAILVHCRQQFNSSSIPNILMNQELWMELGGRRRGRGEVNGGYEKKLLQLFCLSDCMQWTSTIRLYDTRWKEDVNQTFLKNTFSHLINNNRYFCRSLKKLKMTCGGEALALICESVPHLDELDLINGKLSASDLTTSVSKLVHLRRLDLYGIPNVTDETLLPCVRNMKSLEFLNLRGAFGLSDDTLCKVISSLPSLRCLDVSGCDPLGDKVVQQIAASPTIEELDLSYTKITDSSLKFFETANTPLKKLAMASCTEITAAGFDSLIPVLSATLTELDLTRCAQITDDSVEKISQLASLKKLAFSDTYWNNAIDDASCQCLAKNLSHLEVLDLGQPERITDVGIEALSKITSLTDLQISGAANATKLCTPEGIISLCTLKGLRELSLRRMPITDAVLEGFAASLPYLTRLDVALSQGGMDAFGDDGLKHISSMQNIVKLLLDGATNVTDAGLTYLESLHQLSELGVYKCTGITAGGVEKFQKAMPHIEEIRLGY